MKLRRRRRRSGGFYLFASHLLFLQLLRVVNSNIWFQFVPLGVDYNLNSLLSWFKSSHPSSSEENVYAPLHSSLIFPIMIKFVVYENFPSMSFSACKNKHFCRALQLVPREKLKLRKKSRKARARQGWHLTVVMRDKWGGIELRIVQTISGATPSPSRCC